MGRIRVLEESVANQIAAGEVVERPASVVKELVENALDAGASRIDIEVEQGGADLIRVSDDGCGMDPQDARLAFERHATSKIRRAGDLQAITSFGFRGEALPSIASVSRMILTTSTGAGGGTRVRLGASNTPVAEPAGHPRGTTVEVAGLFANAPARRKFLRSVATETAHIADGIARLAAAHPAIAFSLKSGGRELLAWPAAPDHRERVAQIVGREDAADLLEVRRGVPPGMRVIGLASGPALHRSTTRDEYLYVNGRAIRDRRLLHAVQAAYATLLPRGRFPVLYLFLEIPPQDVDVNVHPAKSEVRFQRATAVHDLVRQALLDALGVARPFYRLAGPGASDGRPPAVRETTVDDAAGITATAADEAPRHGESTRETRSMQPTLVDAVPLAPLAQFRDSYILATSPDGLVIVDQHAAHERVLYERFLVQSRAGRVERQRLLFPATVDLSPAQMQAFEGYASTLAAIGFGAAPFGEATLVIDEVPALLATGGVERLIRELLDEALEWPRTEGVERLRHRMVATAACHAAVTANHPLDPGRMSQILLDLMRTAQPMTCPHGRPALLRLSLEQIEKEFHRR
ncbi:MAG TPA: DNA mismatch repair endonuclease MutL [Candidatus Polarisedimenticolia bacterium]|nr:DNA mismatch repair endonuclease MutL [Candidatus Polarisedimenticolia bacterium]